MKAAIQLSIVSAFILMSTAMALERTRASMMAIIKILIEYGLIWILTYVIALRLATYQILGRVSKANMGKIKPLRDNLMESLDAEKANATFIESGALKGVRWNV